MCCSEAIVRTYSLPEAIAGCDGSGKIGANLDRINRDFTRSLCLDWHPLNTIRPGKGAWNGRGTPIDLVA
jgi:hypothetical protein